MGLDLKDWRLPLWRESRAPLEWLALARSRPAPPAGWLRASGEPVLVLPAFLAGDAAMTALTSWLRSIGYRAYRGGIVVNADCASAALRRLGERVEALAERRDRRVTIIGHSRGGCFARILATRRPDLVQGIITLGSPLLDPLAIHPLLRLNVRALGWAGSLGVPGVVSWDCLDGDCCADVRAQARAPFPPGVGFVSVYSRTDGLMHWDACLDPEAEHVEVRSSHLGMAVNCEVFHVVAGALAAFHTAPGAAGAAAA